MPSADIGQGVPQLVEAANYDWKWYYSASGLAIWLALILAFVVPRANRDIRVLLILAPLIIVNILWWRFVKIASMNSVDRQEFNLIFNSMAVALTVLWLTANYFERFGGFLRFLLSFAMVVIVAGLGTLSYSTEFSDETMLFLALFVFVTFTMLAAATLARVVCKGKYRPVRFMLWLALWTLFGSMLAIFGFFITGSYIMSSGPSGSDFSEALLILAIAGPVLGLVLYMLNLPFFLLGFINPFFRERFCGCLRLESIPAAVTSDGTDPEASSEAARVCE